MTFASSPDRKYRRGPKAPLISGKHHRDVFDGAEGGLDGASFSGAVFNLATTIVGAGIMALPATLKQLGMIPGLIVVVAAAFLTESSIDMILRFSRASKSSTYAGLVGDAFGGFGRSLLQFCVVINNIGMLVVYLIIIGDVLAGTWAEGLHHTGVMEEWFGQSWWTTRFLLLLLTTLFVFGPLISFKRVDSLRYTSALSVGLAIAFVAITAGIAIVKMMEGGVQAPPMLPKLVDEASFWKLFTTIPVLVTAYICHHNIHPIENELIDTSQMKPIVRTSLTLCTSVYVATSFFGYLLFGEHTLDDILANFDGDLGIPYSSLLNDVVRVSYCIHLMLVFPIVFFSLRINFDGLLFPYAVPIAYDNKRFFSITAALMGIIFLGANFVPSIWDAFQFTGATTAVSVGYIFPAAVCLSLMGSFVPFGGFFPTPSDFRSPLSVMKKPFIRCSLCNEKCDRELSAISKGTVSVVDQHSSSLPSWLQMANSDVNKEPVPELTADNAESNAKELQRKWDDICQRIFV